MILKKMKNQNKLFKQLVYVRDDISKLESECLELLSNHVLSKVNIENEKKSVKRCIDKGLKIKSLLNKLRLIIRKNNVDQNMFEEAINFEIEAIDSLIDCIKNWNVANIKKASNKRLLASQVLEKIFDNIQASNAVDN